MSATPDFHPRRTGRNALEPFRAVGGYFTVIVPFISDEWKSQR